MLVQNVSILGGFVGVNFACDPCDGSEPPTNGRIEHNTIVGTFDNGILIANSTNASIEQNTIAGAGFAAIQLGFSPSTTVSGVTVHKNTVVGNTDDGILVHRGATGNTLSHNTVVGNGDNGIAVWSGASNSATSTSNTITKNEAVLNGDGVSFFDLFHDGGSSPNAWVNNTCITKLGADIPAC